VVAKLTPIRPATLEMFGALQGKVQIHGDIVDTSDLSADAAWTADEHIVSPKAKTKATRRR
jgi:hypothetical protein